MAFSSFSRILAVAAAALSWFVLTGAADAGLLASWEFDLSDASGSSVAATAGSAANTTGLLQADASAIGGELRLDGTDDYLQFGNNLTDLRGLSEMTVAAWVNVADSSTAQRRIVEHEDNFYFWQESGAFRYTTHGTGGDSKAVSTTAPSAGTWQHVLAVYRAGQPAEIYVNGVLEDTSGANQANMANNTQTFQIGARRGNSGSPTNFFNGVMDDVAVWDEALSAAQIEALAGAGSGGYFGRTTPTGKQHSASTLAFWEFDDKAPGGTTVNTERIVDSSGHGRDAFAGGGATPPNFVAGSPLYGFTSALRFTTNRDSVIFRDGFSGFPDGGPAAGSDINFDQDDSFTVEAVLRTEMSGAVGAIVAKDDAGDTPSWWLRIQSDGRLQAIVDDRNSPDPNVNGLVNGVAPINDNEWHHVAFVRDAEEDKVRLFIDYSLDAEDDDDTLLTSFSSLDIRIGESNKMGWQFVGDIDFVRISAGALDPSQFVQQVPEPASVLLLAAGAICLALGRMRRRGSESRRGA